MSNRDCTCMAWQDQINKINAPIALQQIRSGHSLPPDHFIAWNHCPWCGRDLRSGLRSIAVPSPVSFGEDEVWWEVYFPDLIGGEPWRLWGVAQTVDEAHEHLRYINRHYPGEKTRLVRATTSRTLEPSSEEPT